MRDRAVVCVTGGYETAAQIEDALSSGVCDMVGLARPFCVAPSDLSAKLAADNLPELPSIQTILWSASVPSRLSNSPPLPPTDHSGNLLWRPDTSLSACFVPSQHIWFK